MGRRVQSESRDFLRHNEDLCGRRERAPAREVLQPSDDALTELDSPLASDALAVTGGEAVFEALARVAPEQDGEHLEVDDALEQFPDTLEQIVEVKDAGDLTRDKI